MNPLLKKIAIATGVILVLFLVYKFFIASPSEAPLSAETPTGLPAEESDLISLLLELKSISLSTEILDDIAFQSLEDFTVTLTPEPVGRRNPFTEIGADEGPANDPVGTTTGGGQ